MGENLVIFINIRMSIDSFFTFLEVQTTICHLSHVSKDLSIKDSFLK